MSADEAMRRIEGALTPYLHWHEDVALVRAELGRVESSRRLTPNESVREEARLFLASHSSLLSSSHGAALVLLGRLCR